MLAIHCFMVAALHLQGVKYDAEQHKLFVAGALSGKAFVYSLARGSFTEVVHRQMLMLSPGGYLNDVAVGATRVYFSDSFKPFIHSIPRVFGWEEQVQVTSHYLGLNFIGVPMVPILEAANGLVEAAPGVLFVSNYKEGQLYMVNVTQGSNALEGVQRGDVQQETSRMDVGMNKGHGVQPMSVANLQLPLQVDGSRVFPDGLILDPSNSSILYVADNFNNRILKVQIHGSTLAPSVATASVGCVLRSPAYNTPTTLAIHNRTLWAVNAHFLACLFFLPCTWQEYEIVGIKLQELC